MTLNQEDFNIVIGGRLDALHLEPTDILVITIRDVREDTMERAAKSFERWLQKNDIPNKWIVVSDGVELGTRAPQ